ncbi:MAG: DUF444 family protein [Armatimonadetes bacterium]|nr:DUF444 family protein [Armatimonadota bacterium]MDW8121320.1 DUF444 family protein [Armatimonadota bacterium]
MAERIERDWARFRDIVRGKIRQNLRRYVAHRDLIGRQGRSVVSIPIPQIELPHFTYQWEQVGGIGQGEGEEGEPLWLGEEEGSGRGGAGWQPGLHPIELEVTIEEMVALLGEELELPALKNKSAGPMESLHYRYRSLRRVGPESLRHFRRTYREALKRQLQAGLYNPDDPKVIPIQRDKRYRAPDMTTEEESRAVIFFMMDVSGSMGDRQKELVRTTAFWIDQWIKRHYQGVEHRYIAHDAAAREVSGDLFYKIKESGGTKISSAYDLCAKMIARQFDPDEWNIYAFHFSDGDNWEEDDETALHILKDRLLPTLNLFGYCQVKSHWGTGRFLLELSDEVDDFDNVRTTEIASEDQIFDAIKDLLGRKEGRTDESTMFQSRPSTL